MRFNPPPNWPQPPAGWTPPPGWEPDPSWPRPPSGWRLWVPDDEFVISPSDTTQVRTRSMPLARPWHQRTLSVVLLLIFFCPVGLVLLWLRHDWSVRRRGIITAVVGLIVIIIAPSVSAPQTKPTALSPTTVSGTVSPSTAPTASRSAVPSTAAPSPVATTPRAPATSAPPKPSAAPVAVVHTSAAPAYAPPPAPVRTTQAPQAPPPPVQTTAAQRQSCTPRTDAGNCYEPGEYCRDDDHGVSGIDAEGDPITCEYNDGWRWERT